MAVNGACLTVTAIDDGCFAVDITQETLSRSSLGSLVRGDSVNLERALTMTDRIGGHLVQGHVDAVGVVASIRRNDRATMITISAPASVMGYIVEKGCIAVDGISLTVADCGIGSFTVAVVEYTKTNTTLHCARPGRAVNLEADVIAKYIEKFTRARQSSVTEEFLAQHGY
jgi:riboflavin synthase